MRCTPSHKNALKVYPLGTGRRGEKLKVMKIKKYYNNVKGRSSLLTARSFLLTVGLLLLTVDWLGLFYFGLKFASVSFANRSLTVVPP